MAQKFYRNPIILFFVIVEIVALTVFLIFCYKESLVPYRGFLIDQDFLNNLVQKEIYKTIKDIAIGILIFFGGGLICHSVVRNKLKKDKLGFWLSATMLPIAGILFFALPKLMELPARLNEPPKLQTEIVTAKFSTHSKSGTNYHLMFSSGSRQTVSFTTYSNTYIKQIHYTIYQGDLLIYALPADQYVLKVK